MVEQWGGRVEHSCWNGVVEQWNSVVVSGTVMVEQWNIGGGKV